MTGRRWLSLADIGQLSRASVLGVTFIITLQGLASSSQQASTAEIVLSLVAALSFHGAVYLWNDLVDLPIDRTDPRRASSPLVAGTVRPAGVTVASFSCAAVALLLAGLGGASAVASMFVALVLLGAYDLWSKTSTMPPLMDLVQGVGWAALAWFGASIPGDPSATTVWLGVFVTIALLLVNGVLGGVRDLVNDAEHGAHTTAILFGASVDADGAVHLPRRLIVYADGLHAAQVTALAVGMVATQTTSARLVVLLGGAGVGGWILLRAVLRLADDRTRALRVGFGYLVVMLLAPCLLVADGIGVALGVVIGVLFAVPWLCSRWFRTTMHDIVARRRTARVSQ